MEKYKLIVLVWAMDFVMVACAIFTVRRVLRWVRGAEEQG